MTVTLEPEMDNPGAGSGGDAVRLVSVRKVYGGAGNGVMAPAGVTIGFQKPDRMDAGVPGGGMVVARGRLGAGPVVIVVVGASRPGAGGLGAGRLAARVSVVRGGGRARGDSGGRARSLAGREAGDLAALLGGAGGVVLVVGGWPGGVLAVGGAGTGRLAGGGAAAAGGGARGGGNVFRREGEYWTVVFDGVVVRLKDAKGLRQLARLLADPGREFHAVDLEAAEGGAAGARGGAAARAAAAGLAVRPGLGDAGAWLDAPAKAAYRARLGDLRAERADAQACQDPARAAAARAEEDFLVAELARAVGLGGRDRRAACHAERARLNATRAIRAALARLARAHPALGAHLAATIRTGRYCCYTPDPRAPITWQR